MWPFSRTLDELREEDLQGLIGVRENISLEFKREMYPARNPEKKLEMLRDIASMANAEGGVFIIGMAEDGLAQATQLQAIPNAEEAATRIVHTCRTNIAEVIPVIRTHRVTLAAGGEVLVVYIARSFRRPHMVTTDESTEFLIRQDRHNLPMSIAAIRSAITTTEDAAMKAERFVRERHRAVRRVLELAKEEPLLTLTATPLLLEEGRVDLETTAIRELVKEPPTYGPRDRPGRLTGMYPNVLPTLHGIRNGLLSRRRIEVFRTGHVEYGSRDDLFYGFKGNPQKFISNWYVAKSVRNFVHFAMRIRGIAQISDPYLFGLTFWRTAGLEMIEGLEGGSHRREARGAHEHENPTTL